MKLFTKFTSGAQKVFNKITDPNNNSFRKFVNTARKTDNTIAKIGHFLAKTSNEIGYPGSSAISKIANEVVRDSHIIRKNMIGSSKLPMNVIRNDIEKAVKEDVAESGPAFI